jgi:hypothetical protein
MLVEQAAAGAAGAVQYEDGVVDLALRIAMRFTERGVVQAQLGQGLSRGEVKITDDVIAFRGARRGEEDGRQHASRQDSL